MLARFRIQTLLGAEAGVEGIADAYFGKPYDITAVIKRVRSLLAAAG